MIDFTQGNSHYSAVQLLLGYCCIFAFARGDTPLFFEIAEIP